MGKNFHYNNQRYIVYASVVVILNFVVACGYVGRMRNAEMRKHREYSHAIPSTHDSGSGQKASQPCKDSLGCCNQLLESMSDTVSYERIKAEIDKEVTLFIAQKDTEIERQQEIALRMRWVLRGELAFIVILLILTLYVLYRCRRQRILVTDEAERTLSEDVAGGRKPADDRHAELFRRMRHELEDNQMFLDVNLSRELLAAHLDTNRTYVSEAVAQMTGMTFPQYISQLRVSEAERRLRDSSIDVSNLTELGRSLGFASLSTFQTAFKRQTGMTLSAYREEARK